MKIIFLNFSRKAIRKKESEGNFLYNYSQTQNIKITSKLYKIYTNEIIIFK